MSSKTAPAKAGDNRKRTLSDVEAAWDILDRDDIFARGALLIDARALCPYGQWGAWLRARKWDDSTATRAMDVCRLGNEFLRLRKLPLPLTVLYDLTETYVTDGKPDPEMPSIVTALVRATGRATAKKERLEVADLESVIVRARQRFEYGNFPVATWDALDNLSDQDDPWVEGARNALKRERPNKDTVAESIVTNIRLKFLERAEKGEKVEQGKDEQSEPPPTPTSMLPPPGDPLSGEILPLEPKPQIKETDQAAATAVAAANGDVGGKAEIERLKVDVEALQNDKSRLQKSLEGRDREIKDLEEKLKDDTPKGTINKLVEALGAALKKSTREKAIEVVEGLCAKLGINPHKQLNPPDSSREAA